MSVKFNEEFHEGIAPDKYGEVLRKTEFKVSPDGGICEIEFKKISKFFGLPKDHEIIKEKTSLENYVLMQKMLYGFNYLLEKYPVKKGSEKLCLGLKGVVETKKNFHEKLETLFLSLINDCTNDNNNDNDTKVITIGNIEGSNVGNKKVAELNKISKSFKKFFEKNDIFLTLLFFKKLKYTLEKSYNINVLWKMSRFPNIKGIEKISKLNISLKKCVKDIKVRSKHLKYLGIMGNEGNIDIEIIKKCFPNLEVYWNEKRKTFLRKVFELIGLSFYCILRTPVKILKRINCETIIYSLLLIPSILFLFILILLGGFLYCKKLISFLFLIISMPFLFIYEPVRDAVRDIAINCSSGKVYSIYLMNNSDEKIKKKIKKEIKKDIEELFPKLKFNKYCYKKYIKK